MAKSKECTIITRPLRFKNKVSMLSDKNKYRCFLI